MVCERTVLRLERALRDARHRRRPGRSDDLVSGDVRPGRALDGDGERREPCRRESGGDGSLRQRLRTAMAPDGSHGRLPRVPPRGCVRRRGLQPRWRVLRVGVSLRDPDPPNRPRRDVRDRQLERLPGLEREPSRRCRGGNPGRPYRLDGRPRGPHHLHDECDGRVPDPPLREPDVLRHRRRGRLRTAVDPRLRPDRPAHEDAGRPHASLRRDPGERPPIGSPGPEPSNRDPGGRPRTGSGRRNDVDGLERRLRLQPRSGILRARRRRERVLNAGLAVPERWHGPDCRRRGPDVPRIRHQHRHENAGPGECDPRRDERRGLPSV